MLGQCSSLTKLYLCFNGIDDDGIAMLRACWPGDSGLEIDDQFDEEDQFFDDELEEEDQFLTRLTTSTMRMTGTPLVWVTALLTRAGKRARRKRAGKTARRKARLLTNARVDRRGRPG